MNLLIFGMGYCGAAVARLARGAGAGVTATSRSAGATGPEGVTMIAFRAAAEAVEAATHILVTAPPSDAGDPVLACHGNAIGRAQRLAWIGYLSTTGVYGDRGGGWVDETSTPAPIADRSKRRLAAEIAWREAAGDRPLDIFRLAGIYGPGRSALDDLRAGRARRVVHSGHAFGRIHVDDIAAGVMAAMARPPAGARVLNFSDDAPAESAVVIEEAARLLGMEPPPAVPFDQALGQMSDMARSFWAENRRVSSRRTQQMLGRTWRYPSYREGLRAILQQERADHAP